MKTKLLKVKTKTQQVNAVVDCLENLLVALQSYPNYFTDAETFEQCHSEVALKLVARVKAGKVKGNCCLGFDEPGDKVRVAPLVIENLLYFVKDGFDLDLIRQNVLEYASAEAPELALEILDDEEERADATSSHIDPNTFNK
jgi:hypothetical protein